MDVTLPNIKTLKPPDGRVYLDHNATTPPLLENLVQYAEWIKVWGNPSSIHWAGRGPKTVIREARENLAKALSCHPLEIIFTSGGSEANNLILRGTFEYYLKQGRKPHEIHFITSTIEHPSIRRTLQELEILGASVSWISVDRTGQFNFEMYENHFKSETVLVSIMYANNETGTILPLAKIIKVAHDRGVRVHSDLVQTLGKMTLNLNKLDLDYASFSAHKFYSLKGVGWLYAKKNAPLVPQITGGGQERQRRGGTENILAIQSVRSMVPYLAQVGDRYTSTQNLREFFESEVSKKIPDIYFTAAENPRLPNTSSLVISGIDGETLLMRLDLAGYAVSTGAACSSGSPEPSPVLLAMGLSREEAQSSLRVSLGYENTKEELINFINDLEKIVLHLRSLKEENEDELE